MTQDTQYRIGPILLSPGITRREVFIFLGVTGIASTITAFLGVMLPFVYNEVIGVPTGEQGRLAGQLMTAQQIAVIIFVGLSGALADRIGRKVLLVTALLGFSFSALVYPLLPSVLALFGLQILYGIFSTFHTASGPTKFFDYPDNGSRGKFMAMVMIWMAILVAVLIGGVGANLPGWFRSAGANALEAGTWTLWLTGGVGLVVALLGSLFLMRDRPAPGAVSGAGLRGMLLSFREVMRTAKGNRNFAMLIVSSFVVRTDDAVLTSFLALWVTIQGAREGVDTVDAVKIAATLLAIIRIMHLIIPPILGTILDRMDRAKLYMLSIFCVGLVFVSAPLVTSVQGWQIYAYAVFVGIVEASQTICQQAFFGQEAPAHLRGTSYGLLAIFGTASVVVTSIVAGYLFDAMGPTAPFVLIGLLHLIAVLACLAVMAKMGPTASAR